jgi:hypothetical protein
MACLMFLAVGCTVSQQQVRPEGCEDSMIYDYMANPTLMDTTLKLAVYTIADEMPQFKEPILKTIEVLMLVLSGDTGGMDYKAFAAFAIEEVGWLQDHAGIQLLIIADALTGELFELEIPITQCDRDLILNHLDGLKLYVQMAKDPK